MIFEVFFYFDDTIDKNYDNVQKVEKKNEVFWYPKSYFNPINFFNQKKIFDPKFFNPKISLIFENRTYFFKNKKKFLKF